jgi:hypothetical protein
MKVVFLGLSVTVSVGDGMDSVAVGAVVVSICGFVGVARGEGVHADRVTKTQIQQDRIRDFIYIP